MSRNTIVDLSKFSRHCDWPASGQTERAGPIGSGDVSKFGGEFCYFIILPEIGGAELPDGQSIEYTVAIGDNSAFSEDSIRYIEPLGRQVGASGKGAPSMFLAIKHPGAGGQFATLQIKCSPGAKPSGRGVDLQLAVW